MCVCLFSGDALRVFTKCSIVPGLDFLFGSQTVHRSPSAKHHGYINNLFCILHPCIHDLLYNIYIYM